MTVFLTRLLERLILPPSLFIWLLLLVLWRLRHPGRPGTGQSVRGLLWLTIALIYALTIPATADLLIHPLEHHPDHPPLSETDLQNGPAGAIVILGYGRYPHAPEYGGRDTLSTGGLARVRYGAWLHRRTGLPILVAGGGKPEPEAPSEGELMKRVLTEEFGVPVRWVERESRNTWENARNASSILEAAGIRHIYMVTHGRDLERALWSFERSGGLKVTPAPTLFRTGPATPTLLAWIPNPSATAAIAWALHEWLGQVWYRLRHGF